MFNFSCFLFLLCVDPRWPSPSASERSSLWSIPYLCEAQRRDDGQEAAEDEHPLCLHLALALLQTSEPGSAVREFCTLRLSVAPALISCRREPSRANILALCSDVVPDVFCFQVFHQKKKNNSTSYVNWTDRMRKQNPCHVTALIFCSKRFSVLHSVLNSLTVSVFGGIKWWTIPWAHMQEKDTEGSLKWLWLISESKYTHWWHHCLFASEVSYCSKAHHVLSSFTLPVLRIFYSKLKIS